MNATKSDPPLIGIDLIRYAHDIFNACLESFNERFTAEQLINIARAARQTEWDFYPDEWAPKQIEQAAKNGTVPKWRETENGYEPVYAEPLDADCDSYTPGY